MSEGKFTEFEKQAMEAKRQGKRISVDEKDAGEGPPVVSLTEFAGSDVPPPAPGPASPDSAEPAEPAEPIEPTPPVIQSEPSQASQEASEAEMEQMKAAVFGKVEGSTDQQKKKEDEEGEEQSDESERLFEQKQCPRCGWVLENQALNEPTAEDKLEFMESILGNRRFVRRIEFLGGRLKATYRTVLVKEEDAITEYLNSQMDRKTIQNEGEWAVAYHRCRLVTMLQELELGGEVKKYDTIVTWAENEDNLVGGLKKALDKVPAGWPLSIHGLLVQGMTAVDEIYNVLMSRAYDPNFWEGQTEESN